MSRKMLRERWENDIGSYVFIGILFILLKCYRVYFMFFYGVLEY